MASRRTPPVFRPELVPRWAKLASWGVLVVALPSVLWRLSMAVRGTIADDNPCFNSAVTPVNEMIYVIGILPVVQVGLALLTFGLIRPWGEAFPKWMPVIGGHRVPVSFGAGLALFGVLATTVLMVSGMLIAGEPLHELPPGCTQPGWDVIRFYLPMVLWPPLLLAVTVHYLRRRRIEERQPAAVETA